MRAFDCLQEMDEFEDFRIIEVQRPRFFRVDHRRFASSRFLFVVDQRLNRPDYQIVGGDAPLARLPRQLRVKLVRNVQPDSLALILPQDQQQTKNAGSLRCPALKGNFW